MADHLSASGAVGFVVVVTAASRGLPAATMRSDT
jgi:hypothetical protein